MQNKTLLVIGGGAAGFFCAINAAEQAKNLKVVILEKSNKLLSKVRISGGGRCNTTHACFDVNDMSKRYPRGEKFVRKAFQYFFTTDTIEWFKKRDVTLKTEADGRMFPDTDNSETIISCFIKEVNRLGIEIMMNAAVTDIVKTAKGFQLSLSGDRKLSSDFLLVASGGFPKLEQYSWLHNLQHTITAPVPSLFTFNIPKHAITALMGVVVSPAQIKIAGSKLQQDGPVLITHWGLSGPCVLKLSAYAALELAAKNWQFQIQVNWLPSYNENTLREAMQSARFSLAASKVANKNPFGLPSRFWEYLLAQSEIALDVRWADLPAKEQNKLIKNCCTYELHVNGKTTFKEEFVTAGGIETSEVDANTLESRKMENLFFAGEILNVDGVTGGFNFQNAWTTGYIAAKTIAHRCNV